MPHATDVTDAQWAVLAPLLVAPGKPGRKHADLRTVVNGLLYVSHTPLPVEVPASGVRVVVACMEPVLQMVCEWHVDKSAGRAARDGTHEARSRRLAKSFENTTGSATGWLEVACIADVLAKAA